MIRIPDTLFRRIADHTEQTYPEECCGVLLGTEAGGERVVTETFEIGNSRDADRRTRFLISPGQYREAERQALERKLDLLGFYHSHPDHPARPSEFDTEHALPWFTYLIVSVDHGRAADATAWVLQEDRSRFAEQVLSVDAPAERASTVR